MATPTVTEEERRIEVLDAAIAEFGTYGYHGGSTERIAAAANISQPNVLRLYGTKLKLFLATLEYVHETILARWEQSLAKDPDIKGWDALMVLGRNYAQGEHMADRLRMLLQGAAASESHEIELCMNHGMDMLWDWVQEATGATDDEIERFWAVGMMQTMAISMNATKYVDTSVRARRMFPPQYS